MKKLMILVLLLGICSIGKSQVVKPDTLYLISGRVLPCKIIEHNADIIKVLPNPQYTSVVEVYKTDKIEHYVKEGVSITPKQILLNTFEPNDTIKNEMSIAGDLLFKSGTNLLWSDIMFISAACLSGIAAADASSDSGNGLIYTAGALGLTGIILRFVGNAQTRKAGYYMIKNSEKWSVVTNGSSLIVKF